MARQVLVVCGDQYHPASDVMSGLAQACRTDFEFHQADDATRLLGETMFDAVVLAKLNVKSPDDSSPWVDESQEQLIRRFVESGGGLLVIHAGTVRYESAPLVRALTGGAFKHHPEACSVELSPAAHLMTAGVASFTVHDEHYFVEIDKGVEVF
jgi:type 1 glutamine amidotransferase